jgi:hypothetical protein
MSGRIYPSLSFALLHHVIASPPPTPHSSHIISDQLILSITTTSHVHLIRSRLQIRLTLWGEKAEKDNDWASNPIVAFKGVKVGDYGGRSLSIMNSSHMLVNPPIPEGHQLYHWYGNFLNQGGQATSLSTSGKK